jgi:hypothetical protein
MSRRTLLTIICSAVVVVPALVALWQYIESRGPQPGRARREVQRYYDRRNPGQYVVGRCQWSGDSHSSAFGCEVSRRGRPCADGLYQVPRAAPADLRSDFRVTVSFDPDCP